MATKITEPQKTPAYVVKWQGRRVAYKSPRGEDVTGLVILALKSRNRDDVMTVWLRVARDGGFLDIIAEEEVDQVLAEPGWTE